MSVTSSSSCKFCHPDCKARLQFWMAGKDVTIQEANMRVLYIVPLVHALLCALGCIKIDTPPLWSPSNNLLGPQITCIKSALEKTPFNSHHRDQARGTASNPPDPH
eukprot:1157347-Pelagomonas_calceolata.AAC.5